LYACKGRTERQKSDSRSTGCDDPLAAKMPRQYDGWQRSQAVRANSRGAEVSESDRTVRVRPLHDEGVERDYLAMTPEERLSIMWQLTVDSWAFKGEPLDESRLPRHVVRVIRGRG